MITTEQTFFANFYTQFTPEDNLPTIKFGVPLTASPGVEAITIIAPGPPPEPENPENGFYNMRYTLAIAVTSTMLLVF